MIHGYVNELEALDILEPGDAERITQAIAEAYHRAAGYQEEINSYIRYTIEQVEGKTVKDAPLEHHNCYYDIHVPLCAEEVIGIKHIDECTQRTTAYDEEKDIEFFADNYHDAIIVRNGEYLMISPATSHAPCIGQGQWKKVILKIKVEK